ncbi:MAG: SGNH/GDSL hydrolase family protein [Gammaproteobacteria bacterium]
MTERGKRIATVALSVLLSLTLVLAAEGLVRLRQYIKYGVAENFNNHYVIDEATGLRIVRPNLRTRSITSNSLGFRGAEIAMPKPANTVRLAFLGASTTYSAEVSSDVMTWPHQVIGTLADAYPGRRFDYVNAAVPGYRVAASRRNFIARVAPLDVDAVVIYHAINDMSVESAGLAEAQGLEHEKPKERLSWLSEHSLLWFLLEKNLHLKAAKAEVKTGDAPRLVMDPENLGGVFRKRLIELIDTVREQGVDAIALVTFASQFSPDQSPERMLKASGSALFYKPYMTPEQILAQKLRYNDIIREVARETGVTLVEGEFDIPADPVHFNDSVHFTDAGSTAQARRVSQALLEAPPFQSLFRGEGRK